MADATTQDLDVLSDDDLYDGLALVWGNPTEVRHVEINGIRYQSTDLVNEWTQRLDVEALAETVYE